ncbi:PREDICTED: trypsin-1-like [Dinoponera quadriceps]|uniref:Trypsin-1-like n=1 Tax=Dinoponera quadriceps TaxID=609295 RepID=A0A6P3XWF3_DINQU|nr:PREDICTED: trypsin-1-like [Dinoponera quadriceps]
MFCAPAHVYRLNAGSNDKYAGRYYRVKRIVRHPAYDSLTIDYDIALLELDDEIRFNDSVQPVKLAEKELPSGVMVNITGWGTMTPGGWVSPLLKRVSLPTVNRRTCQLKYWFIHNVTDRMICAGYLDRGGKDACKGDSGGPLTANDILYGIVSWGYGCANPNYPGVYTNVVAFRPWIKWISGCERMSEKLIPLLCVLLVYTVNTERQQYVDIADYPYHVSIQITGQHACSGAFIHESWIMTAASCVFRTELPMITVRVRTSNISTGGDVLEISNIVVHENFDKYVYFNDIALIKLKIPAEFGEKLLPIGLPEKGSRADRDRATCVVTGWKRTLGRPTGGSVELAVAAVAIVNHDTCAEMLPRYKPLSKEMLCACNASRGAETCQGDPGAPLVSEQTLIGVLSYGLGCETNIHPGVYTRVSSYLSWIFANSGIN